MQLDSSKVEELALLVKDNLFSKHLVLSVEEMFVELLSPFSGAEFLELQPMMSYQRMLLHRLAEIFGLAHQSVGEGEDRHLLVGRCENSSIPTVLVSDVLGRFYEDSPGPIITRQLLKRTPLSTGKTSTQPCWNLPTLSLEERQTAYLAARKRIFSDDWMPADDNITGGTTRPRNVPVVARRMIAHALGKAVSLESSASRDPNQKKFDAEVNLGKKSDHKNCGNPHLSHIEERMKDLNLSPTSASKRLFAQAISLSVSNYSPKRSVGLEDVHDEEKSKDKVSSSASACHASKLSKRSTEIKVGCAGNPDVFGVSSSTANKLVDFRFSPMVDSSDNSILVRKTGCCDMPGMAARRILVQALGLQVPKRPSSTWERVPKHSRHTSNTSNGNSSDLSILTS